MNFVNRAIWPFHLPQSNPPAAVPVGRPLGSAHLAARHVRVHAPHPPLWNPPPHHVAVHPRPLPPVCTPHYQAAPYHARIFSPAPRPFFLPSPRVFNRPISWRTDSPMVVAAAAITCIALGLLILLAVIL